MRLGVFCLVVNARERYVDVRGMGRDGMGWDDVEAPTGWGYVTGRDSSVGGTQHPRS